MRLPVLTEKAVSQIKHHRSQKGADFRTLAGDSVTCRKGCSHCCSYPLYISILEGVCLYLYLKGEGLWNFSLRRDLEEHLKQTIGLTPEVWLLAGAPCPLLTDEKTCLAYEQRPFLCRTMLSVGDPYLCRPAEFSAGTPLLYRHDRMDEYYRLEKELLKEMRAPTARVPLSFAVMLGEKLVEGKIDVEDITPEVLKAYAQEGL